MRKYNEKSMIQERKKSKIKINIKKWQKKINNKFKNKTVIL